MNGLHGRKMFKFAPFTGANMRTYTKYALQSALFLSGLFTLCGILLFGVVFYYSLWGGEPPYGNSVTALIGVILTFNIWGFTFIVIMRKAAEGRLSMAIRSRRSYVIFYSVSGIVLLAMTFLLSVLVKFVSGDDAPFRFNQAGFALLMLLWMVEMLVLSLFLIEISARKTVELYRNKRHLEQNAMKIRYQALQNQLNPHFLFNNLSELVAEIESDPSNAVQFVQNLSDIYRYVLHQSSREIVTLKEELEFFSSYLFLYKTRYGDKINIRNDIPQSAYQAGLPPMTLQLLIENALKHNTMTVDSPLCITMALTPDGSHLKFSNNIQATSFHEKTSGTGLVNLSAR